MKKATCRITVGGDNFDEIVEESKKYLAKFFNVDLESFDKTYEKLEIDLHIELNQTHDGPQYYGQCYFRVPDYE